MSGNGTVERAALTLRATLCWVAVMGDGATPSGEDQRFGFAARVALYFGCIFTVFGVMHNYLNAWFVSRGLSLADITLIATIAPFVRMTASPAVTFLADRMQAHWTVMIVSGWLYVAAWLFMASAGHFWTLLLAQLLVAATGAALMPLADALAVGAVKARGLDYGRMRLWGSITFVVASVGAGLLVDGTGLWIAIWLIALGAFLAALAAHLLPRREAVAAPRPLSLADAGRLVADPAFLLFLVAAGALQGGHAMLNVFSVLHWQSQGMSGTWCGVLTAVGVVAEIVLFAYAGTWLARWSPIGLMALGAAASVIRWTAMSFDPPLAMLMPLQVLHGLTFGASHLGAMLFLGRAVPEQQAATGQGLYTFMIAGIAGAGSAAIAGAAYQAYGGQAYLAMAMLAALSFLALGALAQCWNGRAIGEAGP